MPADALTRIRARGHIGIRLGLERMRVLLAQLGDPQRSLRGVLIGGTNGKGSVAAMVASMLAAAGFTSARSPSPHLHSYRERVMLGERPISGDHLDGLLEEVLAASEPGAAEHGPATEFELLTAAAYLWAARSGVDVMVMEVGLGGRLDASNTWDPDVAAITNVGLDHAEFLGDTLAAVAMEKAAIIRPGRPVVTGAEGEALAVIRDHAVERRAPLLECPPLAVLSIDLVATTVQHERLGKLVLPLLGRHQAANAAVAIGIVQALASAGVAVVDEAAIRTGLARTTWPGRLERVERDGLTVLLDGAHNPDGARVLAAALDELAPSLPAGRPTLLMGVMADKEVAGMLDALVGSRLLAGAHIVVTGVPDTQRTLAAADLADRWQAVTGGPVDVIRDDATTALDDALCIAADAGGPLVIAGSLYLVGHLRALLVPDAAAVADG